ncbi:MAG: hypothetical protein ACE5GK_02595 [Nitrospiria bacterium]
MHLIMAVLAILFVANTVSLAEEEMVEGIAARVTFGRQQQNEVVIFYSDLERYQLFFSEPGEEADLPHLLNQVIYQQLLRPEARRFVLTPPLLEAVEARFRTIQKRFQKPEDFAQALRQTGLIKEEIITEIREHLWVETLISERINEFIFISPKAVSAYFQEHPDLFKEKRLEDVAEKIEAFLKIEKENQKKAEYIQRLADKAKIEILLKPKTLE